MISKETVVSQIQQVIAQAVSLSLSNEQNFPSIRQLSDHTWSISLSNAADLSAALKNVGYGDIYATMDQARAYNLKMLDGALVQMLYTFDASGLAAHRLAFFPSPDLEEFQNASELYELDELYADVLNKSVVPFPIRFDYARHEHLPDTTSHPQSHLTLGQYQNCRIPVSAPLTPFVFAGFLLRNFYNTAFRQYTDQLDLEGEHFDECLAERDYVIPHLRLRQRH